jgi:hydrogenase nickel incorporation protein HypB
MCATCGCEGKAQGHGHGPSHEHGPATVPLEEKLLARNAAFAAGNRAWFRERGILALNVVSSPGSGKTTLLVRTIRDLVPRLPLFVIEGDQATSRDAERIRAAGAAAVQINTGTACHLDAHGIGHALAELKPADGSCVVVENVGNLICPGLFDLGEDRRVLVASVTEGEDKPVKYPHLFRSADLVLLNKVDLLPHVDFAVDRFDAHLREVHPRVERLLVSATRGDGLEAWYAWLFSALRLTSARKHP